MKKEDHYYIWYLHGPENTTGEEPYWSYDRTMPDQWNADRRVAELKKRAYVKDAKWTLNKLLPGGFY